MSKTVINVKKAEKLTVRSQKEKEDKGEITWTFEEENRLMNIMDKSGDIGWPKISKQIPGKTAAHCQVKWEEILKRDSKKGNWTEEEDEMLKKWV